MKISPRLAAIAGLLLVYVAFWIPSTEVRYRRMDVNAPGAPVPTGGELLGYAYGFQFQWDAPWVATAPCEFARFAWPSDLVHYLFMGWQILVFGLAMIPLRGAFHHAVRHKMPLSLYTLTVVVLAAVPLAWNLWLHKPTPLPVCDFKQYFEILAFAPHWLFCVLLVPSVVLGYRAMAEVKSQKGSLP